MPLGRWKNTKFFSGWSELIFKCVQLWHVWKFFESWITIFAIYILNAGVDGFITKYGHLGILMWLAVLVNSRLTLVSVQKSAFPSIFTQNALLAKNALCFHLYLCDSPLWKIGQYVKHVAPCDTFRASCHASMAPYDSFLALFNTSLAPWHHVIPSWHQPPTSWNHATTFWHHMTPSWHHTTPSWHQLTPSWHHLTPSWQDLTTCVGSL